MTIGQTVYRQETCSNTMAWAQEECFNAPDGTLFIPNILAQAQGRQNRVWHLEEGQVSKTILLKPALLNESSIQDINHLGMALALGIMAPFKKYGALLKWPNDFMLGHKKMGGMRLELVWLADKPYALILGFSVNINTLFAADHPVKKSAISLAEHCETTFDLAAIDEELIASLNNYYQRWLNGEGLQLFTEWQDNQLYQQGLITVHMLDGSSITGLVQKFTATGDLELLVNDTTHILPFFMVATFEPVL